MLPAVSKDEWDIKEGTDKFMKNALYKTAVWQKIPLSLKQWWTMKKNQARSLVKLC